DVVIRSAGKSDVGRVREQNEDSFLVVEELGLFVVADGMGGHLGGQMASSLAVKTIGEVIGNRRDEIVKGATVDPLENAPIPRILADAVRAACAAIYDTAQNDPELQGMGTTVTAMMALQGRAFIAHVGDSRCYLQRGERVVQITDDHSLVNEQIKAGLITREQARSSRLKNIITRSVGFERDVAVDTFALPLQPNDRFLLCSDGLANFVDDTEIGLALPGMPIVDVPGKLIDLANERGGDDNITVVCLTAETGNVAPAASPPTEAAP
ncbi:MAG TPA: Stp1/IreP family PP2C-type Ser/Thr phosphatase, partial [Myxococcota bacterium]|nr:Stp1/IreP family PP2C-type Ser/Thr phosphatase [Myxococcota bacterium]